MNAEKTIEFILENLADAAAWRAKTERQMARNERQIKGIQKLLMTGVKQLNKQGIAIKRIERETAELRAALKELATAQKDLASAQKRTDERFERWLDRGSNGHNGRAR